MRKRRKLEHAHRTIPDNGACSHQLRRQPGGCVRANVKNKVVVFHLGCRLDRGNSIGRKGFGGHHVGRNGDRRTARFHGLDHRNSLVQQVMLRQTLADFQPSRQHEGVGNAAAHNQLVNIGSQGFQNRQLGGHLAARHNGHQRTPGLRKGLGNRVHFSRQQRAGTRHRCKPGNAVSGCFSAVGGTKRVVHKHVAQSRHFFGQHVAVGLFTQVQPTVFKHDQLAGFDVHAVHPVDHQLDVTVHQFAQTAGHGRQGVGQIHLALDRTAQVGRDHHGSASVQRHLKTRH